VPIHPDVAARLVLLTGIPSVIEGFADPAMRPRLEEFAAWPPAQSLPAVDIKDETAPGPHGPVPVRVYRPPQAAPPCPALVWLHGGGFVMGDLDMAETDWTSREVCDRAGAVVVSVDYRLAGGDITYPVPLDDVVAAVRSVRDDAAALSVDPARISVGGASAGGNLAAAAALTLRDDDGWTPARLILAYPALHPVLPPPSRSVAAAVAELPRVLTFLPEDIAHITADYLGPDREPDAYAMPALGALDGLCPTLVINAEYDSLRASGEAFAAALAAAAVDVRQIMVPGMLHGFLNLPAGLQAVDWTLTLMAETVTGRQ
jgi:acetyl esterase